MLFWLKRWKALYFRFYLRSIFYDINDEENSNDLDFILKVILNSQSTVNIKYKDNHFYFDTLSRMSSYQEFMKNIKSYYFNKGGYLLSDLQNLIYLYLLLKDNIEKAIYELSYNYTSKASIIITSEELYSFLLIKYALGGCNESEN